MRQMSLRTIEKACGGTLFLLEDRTGNEEISAAVLDSRKVSPGALFFATVGERTDGHRFIPSCFEKGALCAVTEKTPEQVERECGAPASAWGAYILVRDSFQALREIAEYYRSTLAIPVVGITGSVGKTSTKEFIASVLSEKYTVLKTEGNFNNEVGLPLTLLSIREEHQAAVVEMGISDFGEMSRLSKMARPTVCVITNIGQCHLENLKTRDGILRAKTEIFEYMDPDGEVCLNGDDDKLCTVTQVRGKKVHFFGLGEKSGEEVYASEIIGRGLFGSEAVLDLAGEKLPVKVPLPGRHMVINAAAAACVGRLMGLSVEEIALGIGRAAPVGGRSNLIRLPWGAVIDDCYNANPVSMKSAIDLLNTADTARAAVLGDMFELGENSGRMHAETGAYAMASGTELLVCIGENARHMYEAAMEDKKPSQTVHYYKTTGEFLEKLSETGKAYFPEGCTVLVKASHGMAFAEIVEALRNL